MSGPKHTPWTPGPWRACKDGACVCGHIWADGDKRVATVHENTRDGDGTVHAEWSREERVANARLIAAAPDLLEALRDMYEGWLYIREQHGDLYGVGWDRAQGKAEAALAKAKGESA